VDHGGRRTDQEREVGIAAAMGVSRS
jgi:hypothetical protein